MKNHIFFWGLTGVFLMELLVLFLSVCFKTENLQDTVAVNEAVQTVQNDWDSLAKHNNQTPLDYVVLGTDGTVLYRTKPGLSESIHAAVSHKDTILDIEVQGMTTGKIIIYNTDAMRSEEHTSELQSP